MDLQDLVTHYIRVAASSETHKMSLFEQKTTQILGKKNNRKLLAAVASGRDGRSLASPGLSFHFVSQLNPEEEEESVLRKVMKVRVCGTRPQLKLVPSALQLPSQLLPLLLSAPSFCSPTSKPQKTFNKNLPLRDSCGKSGGSPSVCPTAALSKPVPGCGGPAGPR